MGIDMNLISLKDGGRFAMSWIAGTNPKALRSNFQRDVIYSVDVIETCEEMIEMVRAKEDKPSFRILFRLCFGTVHIYAEQVQHLYDVTSNFVCFNTFVLKQYSRKRLSTTHPGSPSTKRIRLDSFDDLDISNLLMESEIFNKYTEKNFQFPSQVGQNINKKANTSTTIQIQQITIQHVNWDNTMPDEDDSFGNATQDEKSFLLSGLNERRNSTLGSQKRKTVYSAPDSSPFKQPRYVNESVEDIRYEPSILSDDVSESDLDSLDQTIPDSDKNTTDFNHNDMTQIDFESTREDQFTNCHQVSEENHVNQNTTFEDSNHIPLPDDISQTPSGVTNILNSTQQADSELDSIYSLDDISNAKTFSSRKRKQSRHVFDIQSKISKLDVDYARKYCYDINKKEYLAPIRQFRIPIVFNKRMPSSRLQSDLLLKRFNANVKLRLQQNHHEYNRHLIVEEILEDDYDEFKNLFKLKDNYRERRKRNKRSSTGDEKTQQSLLFEENNIAIVDNNNNHSFSVIKDDKFNTQIEQQLKSNLESSSRDAEENCLKLNCELYEINPFEISFDFPTEAESQRFEWGKTNIMKKLLISWVLEDSVINLKTLILGANRVNAALAFHTLLDLAGQKYIEIIRDKTNSIESIIMGPETIKKINEVYTEN